MKVIPSEIELKDLHQILLGSVSPRPICFASTLDVNGQPNLSPYSFFGVFGSNPPTVIFSPARRVRDSSEKHTLDNVRNTGEVVINMVSYSMVQQMSLSSCEYPFGVSEFVKAGFTPIVSELVKPFRVKESPVQMECKVKEVVTTGDKPGAGNLIICEVVCIHVSDDVLNDKGIIDPHKIDLVARMGQDYYCRASGDAVFEVVKPNQNLGIGFDNLPSEILNSNILTGNDMGLLANVTEIPLLDSNWNLEFVSELDSTAKHKLASIYLQKNQVYDAWQILLR